MTIGTERSPCDEGVVHGGQTAAPCAQDVKPWVLAATILGSSLAFILSSVVNVALPSMQRSLEASVAEMQWIVNAYMLLLGALILVGGLSRRPLRTSAGVCAGHRRFHAGLGRVRARAGRADIDSGAGCAGRRRGALLVPASLAIISATFPPEERAAKPSGRGPASRR